MVLIISHAFIDKITSLCGVSQVVTLASYRQVYYALWGDEGDRKVSQCFVDN